LHEEGKDHYSVGKRGSRFADLFRSLLAGESYIITGQIANMPEPAGCLPSITWELHRTHNECPLGAPVPAVSSGRR